MSEDFYEQELIEERKEQVSFFQHASPKSIKASRKFIQDKLEITTSKFLRHRNQASSPRQPVLGPDIREEFGIYSQYSLR